FDRVLADVPCTGLGALRRPPESRWRRTPQTAAELAPLQTALPGRAPDAARPGGLIAYVTCCPHLPAPPGLVVSARAARPVAEPLRAADHPPEAGDAAAGRDGMYAQFWPHRHGTDAMFLALIRKRG